MTKPIIGITLDSEEGGGYSPLPWYALRKNYAASIINAGGVPLMLAHDASMASYYAEIIDGLVITGGAFDISPELYGMMERHETVVTKNERTNFEFALVRQALERTIPMLGICGGEQLINVVLGGTLIQHIPDSFANALEHEQKTPRHLPAHSVDIKEGSLLNRITGKTKMDVNSSHHQAVDTPGKNVTINAYAPDGVVEGIEYTNHPFCLGLEWHPEYEANEGDRAILKALVDHAEQHRTNR